MPEENEILKKLVVSEEEVTKEMEQLVNEVSKIFKIEQPSGRIIFQDFGRVGIIENPSMSISEISKELGRPMTALSGPIKDLVKQGYVEYLPGRKYRIAYHRIKEIFEKMLLTKSR